MEKKTKRRPFYSVISTTYEGEKYFGPSMVEPCNNLSLEQIVRDFSRGIVHPSRPAMYDEGDDIPEDMPDITDLTDLATSPTLATRPASRPAPPDGERSEPEEGKDGSGAEGAGAGKGAGEPGNGSPA